MEDQMDELMRVQNNMQEVEASLLKLKEKPLDQVFIINTNSIRIMN
jgi:hypothetical protein